MGLKISQNKTKNKQKLKVQKKTPDFFWGSFSVVIG
jgi:hypothetical protein